jgi:hypothetical protein
VPSQLYTSIHVSGFRAAGPILRVRQFSVLRLRSARGVRLTPSRVADALRNTPLQVYFVYVQRQP